MGSETALSIPVIDFSNKDLKPGSREWETVKPQVFKALEEFGCFEAIFSKVPSDLKKEFFNSIEEMFQLPLETKLKTVSAEKPFEGYMRTPLNERLSLGGANIPQSVDSFTSTLWPQGNPNFSKNVLSFSERASELNRIVTTMVAESLGLEKYVAEHLNATNYILRAMKYEGSESGMHPHTDKDFVTILCQNQIDGLEVQTKNGEWIQCNPSPDSFIVLNGDSYHAWTNGRLYSPYHRVTMRGNRERHSAGLFCVPKQGYLVKAPEELIDEEHPMLFKPYDYAEFLTFLTTEAGRRSETGSESALHIYCGL